MQILIENIKITTCPNTNETDCVREKEVTNIRKND